MQGKIKGITRKMMATVSELAMHQADGISLQKTVIHHSSILYLGDNEQRIDRSIKTLYQL